MKIEVRLSGSGGQGVILAGIILAEAAGIHDGKNVVQTQSYGVEARGGASRSEIIISDQEIVFPEVTVPDILVGLNQVSILRYAANVRKDGMLIADSTNVGEIPETGARVARVPITTLAERSGGRILANIVALGVLVRLTEVCSEAAVRQAVLIRVPPGTETMNLGALEVGLGAGGQLEKWAKP
jgi:2-oxoglutarate ferredoxin oxidoreductase subunit gamma